MDMTSNLLCSKKDTEGIVRTNRMLNTEDSVEVSQRSFQTCPKLGDLTLIGNGMSSTGQVRKAGRGCGLWAWLDHYRSG